MATAAQVPGTPRIIAATPTPSENGSVKDGYFSRIAGSFSKATSPPAISEDEFEEDADPEIRARSRSRSPRLKQQNDLQPLTSTNGAPAAPVKSVAKKKSDKKLKIEPNGHLQPPPRSFWRDLSRSPSPLGLIPIHAQFRQFVSCKSRQRLVQYEWSLTDTIQTDPST